MKVFKWILIVFVALLVLLIAIGFAMPREVVVTTSEEINLPPQKVFHFVAGFVDRKAWDPWIKADTAAKLSFEITTGYVDSKYTWEGPRIGKGMMEVDSVDPGKYLLNRVTFSKGASIPEEWTFTPAENGTSLTWSVKMTSSSPVGRLMNTMFKGMILKTIESGKTDLKNYLETHGVTLSSISEIGIEEYPAVEALVCTFTCNTPEMPAKMGESFGKVYAAIGAQKVQPQGMPFALYTDFDQATGVFTVTAGVPVSSGGMTSGDVKLTKFKPFTAAKGLHSGPYDELNGSYEVIMSYAKENNIELTGHSWEFYLNDPADILNPTFLQTVIAMETKSVSGQVR